jgi:N-acetylmuramoyl-L-alanine amidase
LSEDQGLKKQCLEGIVRSGGRLHIDVDKYSKELKQLQSKSNYIAPKPKPNKKSKKAKKLKVKSSNKLTSVRWSGRKLILKFDKKLKSKQINYFTLYDKRTSHYKYVFDIHASMLNKSHNLRREDIYRISLAQHSFDTLRLVIEDTQKVKINFKINSNKLEIKIVTSAKVKQYKAPLRVDRNKVIVIDAGHGGKDPGAVGYKHYREKVVVFKIAKELRRILKSRGYKVYMTREKDRFVKLSHRTKFANRKKADIFVSIHANAVPRRHAKKAHGIECYFLSPSRSTRAKNIAAKENSADLSDMNMYGKSSYLNLLNHHNIVASNKLAIDLQRGMLGALNKKYKNVKDAGVREGPFWVLVGAQMPSVLIEVGFITNPTEAKRLVSSKYRKLMAQGMADGIERYFAKN